MMKKRSISSSIEGASECFRPTLTPADNSLSKLLTDFAVLKGSIRRFGLEKDRQSGFLCVCVLLFKFKFVAAQINHVLGKLHSN